MVFRRKNSAKTLYLHGDSDRIQLALGYSRSLNPKRLFVATKINGFVDAQLALYFIHDNMKRIAHKLGADYRQLEEVEFCPCTENADGISESPYFSSLFEGGAMSDATCNAQKLSVLWKEQRLGAITRTFLLPFIVAEEGSSIIMCHERNTQIHLSAPQPVTDALRKYFESAHGSGNVFVSSQVVSFDDFVSDYEYFSAQGNHYLMKHEKWRDIQYDVSERQAGEVYLPLYGLPVTIFSEFSRVISLPEWEEVVRISGRCIPETDTNKFTELLAKYIHPAACSLGGLGSPSHVAQFQENLRRDLNMQPSCAS